MSQLLTLFFSAESNRRWNYTVQPVAMEPSQAKHEIDRNTPTYMCYGSLLISVSVFIIFLNPSFPLMCAAQLYSTHQGTQPDVCALISPPSMCRRKEYILVWESSDTVCAPGGLPHSSMLDVWLPAREREKERERRQLWNRRARSLSCTADCTVCYLVVISSSSSTCCLISAVTLTVILTAPAPSPCSVNSCKCQLL